MSLIQIADLTRAQVRRTIEAALAADADARLIAEFAASVDWTGSESASEEVRTLIGQLEGWTTEFEEGGISKPKYRELLEIALANSAARVN